MNYFAHRGLFDNEQDYPENTLAAFSRAIEAGYGIELDVRLTKDDKLVVAHDTGLQRICGKNIAIRKITYAELSQYHVLNSTQTIPLFSEVLDLIAGRVPLVVEIKAEHDPFQTSRLTDQALRSYPGPYCIESFDPRVLIWYRARRPRVIRGQLSDVFVDGSGTGIPALDWVLSQMLFTPLAWPDFIAYSWPYADKPAVRFWRTLLHCPLVAWDITSQQGLNKAKQNFDAYIFDSFIPAQGDPPSQFDAKISAT